LFSQNSITNRSKRRETLFVSTSNFYKYKLKEYILLLLIKFIQRIRLMNREYDQFISEYEMFIQRKKESEQANAENVLLVCESKI